MQDTQSENQKRTIKRVKRPATATQRVLTVAQYAAEHGITDRAAWMAIYRGLIPHRRKGRKVIIFRDELEAFLKALPGVTVEEATAKAAERVA
jgi:Helix-turn-helix domain